MIVAIRCTSVAGYVAFRLGDPTAKLLGRLTLNPIAAYRPFRHDHHAGPAVHLD